MLKSGILFVAFDNDGTLVQSEHVYLSIWLDFLRTNKYLTEMANSASFSISKDNASKEYNTLEDYYTANFSGCHPANIVELMINDGIIKRDFNKDEKFIINLMIEKIKTSSEIQMIPGTEKTLKCLEENKKAFCSIVTSTCKDDFYAKYINPNTVLKKYFNFHLGKEQKGDNVYCCKDIGSKKIKPDPDGYIYAFFEFIKNNSNTIRDENLVNFAIVEDSVTGLKSAMSAKRVLEDPTIRAEYYESLNIDKDIQSKIEKVFDEAKINIYTIAYKNSNTESNWNTLESMKPDIILEYMGDLIPKLEEKISKKIKKNQNDCRRELC